MHRNALKLMIKKSAILIKNELLSTPISAAESFAIQSVLPHVAEYVSIDSNLARFDS